MICSSYNSTLFFCTVKSCSAVLVEMSSCQGAVPKKPGKAGRKKTNNFPNNNNSNADVIVESKIKHLAPRFMNFNNPKQAPSAGGASQGNNKSKKEIEFDRVVNNVKQGQRIMILMRGMPGSGKTTLAKKIIDQGLRSRNYAYYIFSADDYFFNRRTGAYEYDVSQIPQAHRWNQQRVTSSLGKGTSPIIIDNTHTQMWEMKPYAEMAVNFCYTIEILEPFTPWAFSAKDLARRNCHGVPKVKIMNMIDRYDKNVTPSRLLAQYGLFQKSPLPLKAASPRVRTSTYSEYLQKQNLNENGPLVKGTVIPLKWITDESLFYNVRGNGLVNSELPTSDQSEFKIENVDDDFNLIEWPNSNELNFQQPCISNTASVFKESGDGEELPKTTEVKSCNLYPTLNLSSWGLTENAVTTWQTWDMVTPVNNTESAEVTCDKNTNSDLKIDKNISNSTTNTYSSDFAILGNNSPTSSDVKILSTKCRDINISTAVSPLTNPSRKTVFDKSSMTSEDILGAAASKECNTNSQQQIENLITLFPNIRLDYLTDVYEKCEKDINWTVDLLLDDKKEIVQSDLIDFVTNIDTSAEKDEAILENSFVENLGDKTDSASTCSEPVDCEENKINCTSPSELLQLKEHLENSVEINKELYSDHILKIKNQRRRLNSEPQCSKDFQWLTNNYKVEDINVSTNLDSENYYPESEEDSTHSEDSEEDETIEINLGDMCVSQLESAFGLPESCAKGYLPIVQVPIWLARQIHAFYIESVLRQTEAQNEVLKMILQQDEELAKKLQTQENQIENNNKEITPNLHEIMEEEAALMVYKRETEMWKKLTPDTLAAKLTLKKLSTSFPSIEESLLMEILFAHNNSYQQTVEVLLASTDQHNVHDPEGNIFEPPISEETLREMKQVEEEINQVKYTVFF